MNLLPTVSAWADYASIYKRCEPWLPALRTICRRHGLDPDRLSRAGSGTNVVFECGDRVIKVIAPLWPEDLLPERLLLQHLAGRLPVRTPELEHEGELEGWGYFVMQRLSGQRIGDCFPTLPRDARRSLTRQLGELMHALHALPVEPFAELAPPGGDWATFRATQRSGIAERLRKQGAGEAWIEQVEAFVAGLPEPPPREPVLLDADLTDDHLLVEETDAGWRITGLFDFADAMLGHPYYEFAAPGVFLTAGDPQLARELLLTYGFDPGEIDGDLARLLTGEVLLHRFAELPPILGRLPGPPTNLAEFQQVLWGFAD